MADVMNVDVLIGKLSDRAAKAVATSGSVVVGYTAQHALFIHEFAEPKTLGLGVPRPSGKGHFWGPADYGPKFLERPAREMANDGTFSNSLAKSAREGRTLIDALLICGLLLQRVSQENVPVEDGDLRASAYTRVEGGAAAAGPSG